MRAYTGFSCPDVAENVIPAANIVKLRYFYHLFAAKFIIYINDTIQAVMLKCKKKAHVLISCTCAGHEGIRGIGSINTLTLNIDK